MRGRSPRDGPLPIRATGIVLGLWIAGMLLVALFIVPALFGLCTVTP